jgi:hypothetical protein
MAFSKEARAFFFSPSFQYTAPRLLTTSGELGRRAKEARSSLLAFSRLPAASQETPNRW